MKEINNELENKIKILSTDYIYNEAIGSLLLLLMNCLENEENKEPIIAHEIHSEILDIKKALKHYVISLESIMNGDKEVKISSLEDCIELKKTLVTIYSSIYRYYAIWNITSTPLLDEIAIRKYKEETETTKPINYEIFYKDCNDFIMHFESETEQKRGMSQLLKCIPLKLTRDKYFDLIYDSLTLAFEEECEESVVNALASFKQTCAPEKFSDYGKYFPDIAEWLTEKKNMKPYNFTDVELEEEYSDFNSIYETLTNIEDYFGDLFNDLNSIIILFYLNFTFDELTENEIAYSDLYHSVCEIMTGEINGIEKNTILDTIYSKLEEYVEPVIDKAISINKKEMALLKKVTDFEYFSDETSKILAAENFVRATYYADINEEIFNYDIDNQLVPAEDTFKIPIFHEFIDFMKSYFSELPLQVRKHAMQMLLGSLPTALSADEVLEYIQLAINTATSQEQKMLIIDKIGMVFSANHFLDDEDCQCGHNHNCECDHTHKCDCDHEHN